MSTPHSGSKDIRPLYFDLSDLEYVDIESVLAVNGDDDSRGALQLENLCWLGSGECSDSIWCGG